MVLGIRALLLVVMVMSVSVVVMVVVVLVVMVVLVSEVMVVLVSVVVSLSVWALRISVPCRPTVWPITPCLSADCNKVTYPPHPCPPLRPNHPTHTPPHTIPIISLFATLPLCCPPSPSTLLLRLTLHSTDPPLPRVYQSVYFYDSNV